MFYPSGKHKHSIRSFLEYRYTIVFVHDISCRPSKGCLVHDTNVHNFFSALNLIIIILKPSNSKTFSVILFKGATKLQFTHFSCAVIILLNKGLYKSAFSTYLFGKLVALPFCAFCVYFFCVKFDVIFLK